MSLTAEQEAIRKGKMTGSRVGALMSGDAKKIDRLYREFIGEVEPENLLQYWPAFLGSATEKAQLDWYEIKNGIEIIKRGSVIVHEKYEWAAATLDGWIDAPVHSPIECKHVGGFEATEITIDRYQPQMQWQCFVTNAKLCYLSIIKGAAEPIVIDVPRADDYIAEMLERAQTFMMCVALKTPPCEIEPAQPPVAAKKIINMTGNNLWASAACSFIMYKAQAEDFEAAKQVIKSLVPEDAARCFGHGIRVTRDRAGRLHIREED